MRSADCGVPTTRPTLYCLKITEICLAIPDESIRAQSAQKATKKLNS